MGVGLRFMVFKVKGLVFSFLGFWVCSLSGSTGWCFEDWGWGLRAPDGDKAAFLFG